MDYFTWSQEYYKDAENVLNTIKKYENALNNGEITNMEMVNSLVANYKCIYRELLNTGRILEQRAKEQRVAA